MSAAGPFILKGSARDIWLLASGLRVRREIRNRRNAKTYDWFIARKLIAERGP